jgi:hypothetical protein
LLARTGMRLWDDDGEGSPQKMSDCVFLATLIAAEGYVQNAPLRRRGKSYGRTPRISIPMYDKAYPERAAEIIGTKLMAALVPTKGQGRATRWTASASGVRATLTMSRVWGELLEGTRKRRFRNWMLHVAVPHAERVARGTPRHIARVESGLGGSLNSCIAEFLNWKAQNSNLPIEPWRECDRASKPQNPRDAS